MAVYNKLTQNKQGKGPMFYLVEKLHTLTWIALARGENKQPTKPPSKGQMLCCKTYFIFICIYREKVRVRWRALPKSGRVFRSAYMNQN